MCSLEGSSVIRLNKNEKVTELWTVRSDLFDGDHTHGYYDMGVFDDLELAKKAALQLLTWLVGEDRAKEAKYCDEGEGKWFESAGIEETWVSIFPVTVNDLPKTLDGSRHITSS